MESVPAANLDAAELRMLERFPWPMRRAFQHVFAPAIELEIVVSRVIAKPVNELVVGNARFTHWRPYLHDPRECTEMLVEPVERSADHRLRVIAKLVEDGN